MLRRWIQRLFARSADAQGPLIHIHEDYWGICTLHPMAARDEVRQDIDAAAQAGERNRAPDDAGWTDMHLIQQPKTTFRDTGLTLAQAVAALEPHMPRVRRFYATISSAIGSKTRDPYGSYDDDAICFGFDRTCFVKVDPDGDAIAGIWFEQWSKDASQRAALRSSLEAIDALTPCFIADYWSDTEGAVADKAFMDRYFATEDPDKAMNTAGT